MAVVAARVRRLREGDDAPGERGVEGVAWSPAAVAVLERVRSPLEIARAKTPDGALRESEEKRCLSLSELARDEPGEYHRALLLHRVPSFPSPVRWDRITEQFRGQSLRPSTTERSFS